MTLPFLIQVKGFYILFLVLIANDNSGESVMNHLPWNNANHIKADKERFQVSVDFCADKENPKCFLQDFILFEIIKSKKIWFWSEP